MKTATDSSDGMADSARCMGLCAHSTYSSTVHANYLQMIQKKQWPSNSPHLNPLQISYLGSDAQSFFESFIWSHKQFLKNKSFDWRRHGKIFHRPKLSRVLERGWESTWSPAEDILNIFCNSKQETPLLLTNRATHLEVSQGHQTIRYVSCGFLLVCYSNFVPKTVYATFWDIQLQKMWNPG